MAKNENGDASEEWEQISAELYHFEAAGEVVEGQLLSKDLQSSVTADGRESTYGQYTLATETGNILINGGKGLDPNMARVAVGDLVRIVYKGEKKQAGGRRLHLYDVFRRPAVDV